MSYPPAGNTKVYLKNFIARYGGKQIIQGKTMRIRPLMECFPFWMRRIPTGLPKTEMDKIGVEGMPLFKYVPGRFFTNQ